MNMYEPLLDTAKDLGKEKKKKKACFMSFSTDALPFYLFLFLI